MLATVLAAVLVLGVGRATGAPADSSTATGRRLLHSPTSTSHSKSIDSWLRWLLFRSRLGEKVGQTIAYLDAITIYKKETDLKKKLLKFSVRI
jgi:hypothetical protein